MELVGLAFPVGIGIQTVMMVALDSFHIPLTAVSMLLSTVLLTVLLIILQLKKKNSLYKWFKSCLKIDFSGINLLWALFILILIAVEVMNFAKCIYFPTFDRDSIAGFDLIGRAIAHEGVISKLSLFNDPDCYEAARGAGSYISYTPLTQCSYAYVYMLGAETSKIVNALHYLSFIFVFYGVIRRFVNPSLAAIATLFTFITPEMIAFSSMSATNVLHAYYASVGVLFFAAWYYKKEPTLLTVSCILLALNIWTRNEGIVFILACCCIIAWQAIRLKQRADIKRLVIFGVTCIALFILWTVYLKINSMEAEQVVILKPFWDSEKAGVIVSYLWMLLTTSQYYGLTFILFAIIFAINILNIVNGGGKWAF
ncbi:MAG: hypothetical protein LBH32_12505 [Dysgonamonadaceae bacterium]|nr:hypothetical protein [Dysgonamonadaceae bacterium]